MNSPKTAHDIEATLEQWRRIDEEVGQLAAERRRAVLGARSITDIPEYGFGEKPNDWVHLDWMRPLRFVYRNLPFGFRMALKKRMAK